MQKELKNKDNTGKKTQKVVLISIFVLIIIISISYIIFFAYEKLKEKSDIQEVQKYVNIAPNAEESDKQIEKIKELMQTNSDIKGWIQIEDTKVNYPILQSDNNEYYLNHNYKKEKSKYGSIYLKSGIDIDDNNSNLILYGHNMKDGEMFKTLLDYADKNYYNEHKQVTIITQNEKRKYQIIAAFKSRIFYKDEKNVFRYYNYTTFKNENMYNEYISNINKIKLYDTEITATYGEQLLTMITCEYSIENGRMIVVAKRIE